MSGILVDSSVWIAFFRGDEEGRRLLPILDANKACVNDLILAEILPSLMHRKETALVDLMTSIEKTALRIDWDEILRMQTMNLKNGLNRVGIPDLIIAQNAMQNRMRLFSLDRHFELMRESIDVQLYAYERRGYPPIQPNESLKGAFKGIDTDVRREDDRQ